MKGYYEGYSYVGFMPDGRKMRFATDTEYREAYAEEARPSLFILTLNRNMGKDYYREKSLKHITKQYLEKETKKMKKVIGILLLVVVMVVIVATAFANDTTVKAEEFEGIVYDNDRYVVMDMLEDWCKSCGDIRALDRTIDENGYFRGCGILVANEFVDKFGVECNIDNMKQILAGNGITECSIVKAGYSDDYAVYKMELKSEDVELGTVYEDNEWKSYYEGFMYFMVVYEN